MPRRQPKSSSARRKAAKPRKPAARKAAKARAGRRRPTTSRKRRTAKKPVAKRPAARKRPAAARKATRGRKAATARKAAVRKTRKVRPRRVQTRRTTARKAGPAKAKSARARIAKSGAAKRAARRPPGRRAEREVTLLRQSPPVIPAATQEPVVAAAAPAVPPGRYRPSEAEPFMNERQREYFRAKLMAWKSDILVEQKETAKQLQMNPDDQADEVDRASATAERELGLRARERQTNLLHKIDQALTRLDDGSYGYCEVTGEPIGLKRLEARPIATLSIEAQEAHERRERVTAQGKDYENA